MLPFKYYYLMFRAFFPTLILRVDISHSSPCSGMANLFMEVQYYPLSTRHIWCLFSQGRKFDAFSPNQLKSKSIWLPVNSWSWSSVMAIRLLLFFPLREIIQCPFAMSSHSCLNICCLLRSNRVSKEQQNFYSWDISWSSIHSVLIVSGFQVKHCKF